MNEVETSVLAALLPLTLIQIIYVIFVLPLAKRRGVNLVFATIMSLIPFIGMFYVMYTFYRSWLFVLDGITELKNIVQTR